MSRTVFVSYVREDISLVARLVTVLRGTGLEVWWDRDSIRPGARWRREIASAISSGGAFVLCCSASLQARQRSYMYEELTAAAEEARLRPRSVPWLYPCRLSDSPLPEMYLGAGESLIDLQAIDLFPDLEVRSKVLAEVITRGFSPSGIIAT